jgi:predicted peptidase
MNFITLMCVMLAQFGSSKMNNYTNDNGVFSTVTVKCTQWGHTIPAILYRPETIMPRGKKYPLIIAFHGKSLAKKDTDKLYNTGILQQLKAGKKIEAMHPTEHELYKFMVLAPHANDWSIKPEDLEYILDDVIRKYPMIDTTRIYVTGYSAGGWGTVMAITHSRHLSSRIAAAVPMSPAPIDEANLHNFKMTAESGLHAWYFAGTSEGLFYESTARYVDSTNKYNKGMARFTRHDGGHCCWAQFYDPAYREGGMNIYEWMLLFRRK